METLDCKDIKVLLSGLVDDEVDAGTRHVAERHLVDCRSCRTVINEAESLDKLIRLDVASMVDPAGLPEGFEGAVLGRTVYEREPKLYFQRWTTWTGWLAAAAVLALAVTILMSDRRAGIVTGRAPAMSGGVSGQVIPAGYATSDVYRSFTLDESDLPIAAPAGAPSIAREDAESIYFAAVLLRLMDEDDVSETLPTVREAIEYDGLLRALAEIRHDLAPADQATLLAAESLLTRVSMGSLTNEEHSDVRDTANRLDLPNALDSISRKWQGHYSL